MELALVIWMISILSHLAGLFGWIAAIAALSSVFLTIALFLSLDHNERGPEYGYYLWAKKNLKYLYIIVFVSAFVATIIPSTKTGWMMAGGYVAQTAIQSDTAKKFALVIENKMQEVLDEATEQAKIKAKSINTEDKTEKKE